MPSDRYLVIFTEPGGKYPPQATDTEVNKCFSENSEIIEHNNDYFKLISWCQRLQFWRGNDRTVVAFFCRQIKLLNLFSSCGEISSDRVVNSFCIKNYSVKK